MERRQHIREREIACQQILEHDSSVFSVQWTTLPAAGRAADPSSLLSRYLCHIRRCTLSLVRPQVTASGGVEFRLMGSSVPLLKFRRPVWGGDPGGTSLTLPIEGGVLVQSQRSDRGELSFIVAETAAGLMVKLQLSGYFPVLLGSRSPSRWRKRLYRLTQGFIHRIVTVRFLAHIHRELAGPGGRTRVVTVLVREGEET